MSKIVKTFENSSRLEVAWMADITGDRPTLVIIRSGNCTISGKAEKIVLSPEEVLRVEAYCREFRGSSPAFIPPTDAKAIEVVHRELLQASVARAMKEGRSIEFRADGSVLVSGK